MEVDAKEELWLFDKGWERCGRLMCRFEPRAAFAEVVGWKVVGAVYKVKTKVVRIADLIFVPFLYPAPGFFGDGTPVYEFVAQLGVELTGPMRRIREVEEERRYIGEIRYAVATSRKGRIQGRFAMHVGEIYATDDERQFRLWLHAIPPVVLERDPKTKRYTVTSVLRAQRPYTAMARARRERKAKQNQNRRILTARRKR